MAAAWQKLYRAGRQQAADLYRRVRSTGRPSMKARLFFLHVAKCGGTSVKKAVRNAYLDWTFAPPRHAVELSHPASLAAAQQTGTPLFAYREQLLPYFLSQQALRFVTGHFQVSRATLNAFAGEWSFVTMLRDPVRRWTSHYFYSRHKQSDHGGTALDLRAFLDTPRATALGQDYARLLTGNGVGHDPSVFEASPAEVARMTEEAKENLGAFDLVGCLEHLGAFRAQFEERYGVALQTERRRKQNPAPAYREKKEQVLQDAELRERIEAICEPNREMYDYAVKNFVRRPASETTRAEESVQVEDAR